MFVKNNDEIENLNPGVIQTSIIDRFQTIVTIQSFTIYM